jgi:hypothetical protein
MGQKVKPNVNKPANDPNTPDVDSDGNVIRTPHDKPAAQ